MPKVYDPLPDVSTILAFFTFNEATGALHWRRTDANKMLNDRYVGRRAGSLSGGYLRVKFSGKSWMVHRLVFKILHGRDPIGEIDHIDGNKLNNVGCNLREVPCVLNTWNRGNKKRQVALPKGVTYHRGSGKFYARIQANGVRRHLGGFADAETAARAYAAASIKHHGEYGRTA
ncbi:MAG: HNH endonuclease [Ochrobactrum anthropi]|uniref:HNH endonuclease n=1 Tax=Brucella anthropi TaxID=529 RepID=A0A8I0N761_BRUAN|nr:HNH endonuclease [Brucella anthropi]MBE0561818.1 HNH endonuclease [Brucella anthropi]